MRSSQSSKPAARAPSATAATRPWYLNPPRSKTTVVMPAAFTRSPTAWPTCFAASTVPVAVFGLRKAHDWFLLLGGLAGLALHALAGVANALALVRLGLAELADVGGDLTDELLVEAAHDDAGRLRDLEGHAFGRLHVHRVREPDGDLDLLRSLSLRAVP